MSDHNLSRGDRLDDFSAQEVTIDGVEKTVHVSGAGPGIIVMPEMPGITPHVARFVRWVRDAGFSVPVPSLLGRDGAVADAKPGAAISVAPVSAPSFAHSAAGAYRARSRTG